ncbi:hypothetical protein [uncultured Desulfuromusa sp.]|uniref:hypothetical protein n=1 Tax=uncultured Desulfuromusa sp. TaxID=219183 RepID=UPI0037491933
MKQVMLKQRKLKKILTGCLATYVWNSPQPDGQLAELLHNARRLLMQKGHDKNKYYSLHETHNTHINKGKGHKKYEFGNIKSAVDP